MKETIFAIREKIQNSLSRSRDSHREVTLLGASKFQPVERLQEAISHGLRDLGENYVQELLEKKRALSSREIRWHLIGPLQSNKVKNIVGEVNLIHSLDRLDLAKKIDSLAKTRSIVQDVLIQVNIGEESSKSGMNSREVSAFVANVAQLSHLRLRGIMVIPPPGNSSETRDYFKKTKDLFEETKLRLEKRHLFDQISMGMSHDFEIAIEEGATIVRIGSALFGERKKS